MTEETPTPKRPKRWLAFLLNLIFPPSGYVYAGMPRAAFAYVVLMLVLVAGLVVWTFAFPPGVYAYGFRGSGGISPWQATLLVGALAGFHAAVRARPRLSLKGLKAWALAVGLVVLLLSVVPVVRAVAPYRLYEIMSQNMAPSLAVDDIVLVKGNEVACRTPKLVPGAIVTERFEGATIIRRLIAAPGQTVEMRAGKLLIDGLPVKSERVEAVGPELWRETLPNGAAYLTQDMGPTPRDDFPPTRIPAGQWFTLGDNRDNSLDSRTTGPSPVDQMCGIAVKRLYANDKAAIGRPL